MTAFNVGIIGLGGMGKVMLSDMLEHDNFTVTVAWDPQAATCKEVQSHHPSLRIADDAQAVIQDPAINLVYVASPPNSHREYFIEAIGAGVPMFCEKPFGVNIAESENLVNQIENAGLINAINFNHGNAMGSCYIEQQLLSGRMGDIAGVDAVIHLTVWPREFQKSATWLGRREQGGFTREMLSHWLYLTRRLLGDGIVAHSHVTYPDDGITAETHISAEIDFGGIPLSIRVATGGVGPVGTEYTVWGTKKSYRLQSGGRVYASDGGEWTEQFKELENISANDRQRTLDGLAARLNGEPNSMATAADGLAVQKLIEALLSQTQ